MRADLLNKDKQIIIESKKACFGNLQVLLKKNTLRVRFILKLIFKPGKWITL